MTYIKQAQQHIYDAPAMHDSQSEMRRLRYAQVNAQIASAEAQTRIAERLETMIEAQTPDAATDHEALADIATEIVNEVEAMTYRPHAIEFVLHCLKHGATPQTERPQVQATARPDWLPPWVDGEVFRGDERRAIVRNDQHAYLLCPLSDGVCEMGRVFYSGTPGVWVTQYAGQQIARDTYSPCINALWEAANP